MKAEDVLMLTPVRLCNVRQKREVNLVSRSHTISVGKPCSQYQWLKDRRAISFALASVRVGMSKISAPSQSVIVRMELKPSSSGRGPTKSMAIEAARWSGTGRGCKGPDGFRRAGLKR